MILQRLVIPLVCVGLLVSCGREEVVDEDIRIGFSTASETFLLERWEKDTKIFMNIARELGAEVVFAKSPGNALGQIPQIQYLLKQDIDVLVVIPQDMELLAGVIKKTMDKGIPVLSYDRPIMGVPISGYISFDNSEVGRHLARSLVAKVPNGNYLIVNGSVRDNNSFEVNRGVHEILKTHIDAGAVRIAEEIWLELWSFDEALEKIGVALDRHPDIDAISCANDAIAGAAIRLLAERQMVGDVAVVGQDADLLACQRLVEGSQLMTVYKPLAKLAGRAAEISVQLAGGTAPEPDQYIDNRSGRKIPFYVELPIAVFRENLEETIIADGFHTREDVYLSPGGQN